MFDRHTVVSDPDLIRARAMESLFERLESHCEGAIAIDRAGNVVYVNEKYLPSLGLKHVSQALGRPIEEIIPMDTQPKIPTLKDSQKPQVKVRGLESGVTLFDRLKQFKKKDLAFILAGLGMYRTRPGRLPPARGPAKRAVVEDSPGDVMSV